MCELVIMVGVPGSGKTTYVDKYYSKTHNILSRDDIRYVVCGNDKTDQKPFDASFESLITFMIDTMLKALINRRVNIVIDNTNTRHDTVMSLIHKAAVENYDIRFVIIDTPIEICKQRRQLNNFPLSIIDTMQTQLDDLKAHLRLFETYNTTIIKGGN